MDEPKIAPSSCRTLVPALSSEKTKAMFQLINKMSEQFRDSLADAIGKQLVAEKLKGMEIKEWFSRFALNLKH